MAVRHDAGRLPDARTPGRRVRREPTTPGRSRSCCTGRSSARSERFIGILIEHYAGALPLWLAPVQAVVLTITDRQADYARACRRAALKAAGFRVATDLRNEKITYKIREHSLQKLPYQLIVGDSEAGG